MKGIIRSKRRRKVFRFLFLFMVICLIFIIIQGELVDAQKLKVGRRKGPTKHIEKPTEPKPIPKPVVKPAPKPYVPPKPKPVDVSKPGLKDYDLNKKDSSFYKGNAVFLISDENWQDVLKFVSVSIWTKYEGDQCDDIYNPDRRIDRSICGYPLLIYHKEGELFDIDSIISFLGRYGKEDVYIVGGASDEFVGFLSKELKSEFDLKINIKEIGVEKYLNFWRSYGDVVLVGNNYKDALLASVYASYLNAPLIFNNDGVDLEGKYVTCVGSVSGTHCNEVYNLEELQKKYLELVDSEDILLVNPNDLEGDYCKSKYGYRPNKWLSSDLLQISYCKDSMVASVFAAAKDEILIFSDGASSGEDKFTKMNDVRKDVQDSLAELGIDKPTRFTVMAGIKAIPQYDKNYVGEGGGDKVDFLVYRIYERSISDGSSNVARDIFNMPDYFYYGDKVSEDGLWSSIKNWFSNLV